MTRLSRTSRINAKRIQTSYVNRMAHVASIDQIHRIERIENTKNQTNHPSENHLLAYDRYYQTELKREYYQLYKLKQQLLIAIEELANSSIEILPQMKKIVQKCNHMLIFLDTVDAAVDNQSMSRIRRYFQMNGEQLLRIGITLNEENSLSFHAKTFIAYVTNSNEAVSEISSHFNAMIDKNDQSKIKKAHPFTSYEKQLLELKGLIIEEER